jgi:nucleoside-diphosphate-sugar epimerase
MVWLADKMRRVQRLLIIGCGDIARRALPWLVKHYRVYAAIRSPARIDELRALGVTPLGADLDRPRSLRRLAGIANVILHFAPPPAGGGRHAHARLLAALSGKKILPRRLVYISTSGVYGDCAGRAGVETVRRFRRRRGPGAAPMPKRACAASAAPGVPCRSCARRASTPATACRWSACERACRCCAIRRHLHQPHPRRRPGRHAALAALRRGRPGRIYNASDDSVLKMGEYFDLLADRFGLPRAPRLPREEIEQRLSPAMLSFMGESRRLTTGASSANCGRRLRHPDVAAALAAMDGEELSRHACGSNGCISSSW